MRRGAVWLVNLDPAIGAKIETLVGKIVARELDVYSAVETLVNP